MQLSLFMLVKVINLSECSPGIYRASYNCSAVGQNRSPFLFLPRPVRAFTLGCLRPSHCRVTLEVETQANVRGIALTLF